MGKKRKGSSRHAEAKGPRDFDPKDARLGPISTYEDVANSEDEHFLNQDTIMLDDEPGSKRRRQDDDMELSDEEILAYEDSDSEAASDDGAPVSGKKASSASKKKAVGDEDDDEEAEEEDEDAGWWGSSKKEYYDADKIETEADAQEEEAEAKRIQKKKLAKMQEEDFVFDGDEWLAADGDAEDGGDTITEVLKEVEVTDDMTPKDRYKMLVTRYPEFEYLVAEFQALQPTLVELKASAKSASPQSLESVKYWVLGCYVASLASYFAILAAPARDSGKLHKPADPSELRDHEVMETLVECRNAWEKVKNLQSLQVGAVDEDESIEDAPAGEVAAVEKRSRKESAKRKADAAKQKAKLAKAKEIEASVADLYDLPLSNGKLKKRSRTVAAPADDDNSDFGEEDALDARTAADKAARKKSLKFYTSQIAQKANRRAGAGRDAGGDMDIPHRERLRDRQARLLAAAEKRGKNGSKHGADLDDNSDEDDAVAAKAVRGEEDEYYDMVAHKAKDKKEDKAARYAAYAAASKADRVVEVEQIGQDGKRKINYAIEKNKGLTPKRSKDVRNPRVKKRKQYEAKQKKLKSMKPVWQGGEPKGGYKGEQSGINVGVVKSTRL